MTENFVWPTRLREALAYSRNIVTIKLLEKVGVRKVIKFANSLGILGSSPVIVPGAWKFKRYSSETDICFLRICAGWYKNESHSNQIYC